jgi:hypothetical protein
MQRALQMVYVVAHVDLMTVGRVLKKEWIQNTAATLTRRDRLQCAENRSLNCRPHVLRVIKFDGKGSVLYNIDSLV